MLLRLGPYERQQVSIDLILMCDGKAMRGARIVDFLCAPDQSCCLQPRDLYRNDLVVLAVYDQDRNINLLEILSEIGFKEGLESFVDILETSFHTPEPELIQHTLRDLGSRPVCTVERYREVPCRIVSGP